MLILLTTIHIIVCIFLILVVLLQQGKGADLSVFGGGSTQAVFGARGAATLLHKLTVAGFVAFIVTTIGIGFLRTGTSRGSVMNEVAEEEVLPEAGDLIPEEEMPGAEAEAMPGDVPGAGDEAAPEAGAPGGESTGDGSAESGPGS